MHATELIWNARNKIIKVNNKEIDYSFGIGEEYGVCMICGRGTKQGFPRKQIIKPTFTNWQDCKNIESNVVCEYCTFGLTFQTFRSYSIYADKNTFKHPVLAEFKDTILNAKPPFVFCIAVSGQKYIYMKSKVCAGENMCVNLEETQIRFNIDDFKYLIEKVEYLYNHEAKFTKEEIRNVEFNSAKVLKIGIAQYEEILSWLSQYKGSKLLELCVHIAQKGVNP